MPSSKAKLSGANETKSGGTSKESKPLAQEDTKMVKFIDKMVAKFQKNGITNE